MTVGLRKEQIITKLNENGDIISESLFEKIAEIIVENNKLLEKQIPDLMARELERQARLLR